MATPSAIPTCLLLLLPTILAMSNSVSKIAPLQTCGCPSQSEINLHYYRHEFPIANDTNRNQEFVVGPKTPFVPFFGNILVHSWSITKRNNANDIIIARMQGTHIGTAIANSWYISSNIAFESGSYAGSTLQVMGTSNDNIPNQWSIVGGTGAFAMAKGTIDHQVVEPSQGNEGSKKLSIRIIYNADAAGIAR